MTLSFAPLEGITSYVYRNTHAEYFGGCDKYYTPFISPSDNTKIGRKGFKDMLPENNSVVKPIVQTLTNNSESFIKFAEKVKEYGYDEINLNLGCPSGTVVNKKRGSGLLREKELLKNFLDAIFNKSEIDISIKTRIGFSSPDEFDEILELYNRYPVKELIVHPRCREDFYKGEINYEAFQTAYNKSHAPVCYNGNIFTVDDYMQIKEKYPELNHIMLGRGAVANPALMREIKGGDRITTAEMIEFTHLLAERYNAILSSDHFTMHKLKEIWLFMMWNFPTEEKVLKTIRRTEKLSELLRAIETLPEI